MNRENYLIRRETPADYREVENLHREAFWNVYEEGCEEHYLVHIMRGHPDFIPELALVLEVEGKLVGSVMYTKSRLKDEQGEEKEILSFGPIGILPEYQRKGWSRILLEHSFQLAVQLGYNTIVIMGDPHNYVSRGFRSCCRYRVCLEGDIYPAAMLVKELCPGSLDNRKWYFYDSPLFGLLTKEAVREYDRQFPKKEKAWKPSQEIFYLMSHSVIQEK